MFPSVFAEVAALLMLAAVCGYVARGLGQPLVVAFVVVGILAGPAVLNWVTSADQVDLLAKMGITLLLFLVGLKLDVHVIRSMGPTALVTAVGQVVVTAGAGYVIAMGLGMEVVTAAYVAAALTFSSTVIIVKLLSDKREIDALHGRLAVGVLIVQDMVVILAMIGLSALGVGEQVDLHGQGVISVVAKGTAFLVCVGFVMRYALPKLLDQLAGSQELLVLFAVAWGVSLAALSDGLGFSQEVGAFVAGVALASTSYRETIGARLVSLRDFLLLFFFVRLGVEQDVHAWSGQVVPALALSLFVLVGKPLIVMVGMGLMGYRRRTGFLTGVTLAQISEFSLILASFGRDLGHIDSDTVGLVTLVGLITIALSSYLIMYSHLLYERLGSWLGAFERRVPHREQDRDSAEPARRVDVIVFGLGRYGGRIVEGLRRSERGILGVDFDPEAVEWSRRLGIPTHYGDAEDPEFPAGLPLSEARWVVSTTPALDVNLALLQALRHHGFRGRVALTAHSVADHDSLVRAGADVVLLPHADAADRAVDLLTT